MTLEIASFHGLYSVSKNPKVGRALVDHQSNLIQGAYLSSTQVKFFQGSDRSPSPP